jgi:hypothetical protein
MRKWYIAILTGLMTFASTIAALAETVHWR